MICFVVALKKEAQGLLEKVSNCKEFLLADKVAYSFDILGKKAILAISGIGKVSAALTTQLLIDKYSPEFIFNFGTCGGMNKSVEILKYYVIEKCCQFDFDLRELDGVPLGYIQEYDSVYFNNYTKNLDFLPKSNVASADRFTDDVNDVKSINDMACSLRDMEGGAISQVCTSNKVPLVMIKGISDIFGNGTSAEQFYSNLQTVGEGFPSVMLKVVDAVVNGK